MSQPQIAPYGSWKSPITSDLIVAESTPLVEIALDGDDLYWSEMRPSEGGRYVVVRRTTDGQGEDVTPAPFNARTRVHEYGGGAWIVQGGSLYFSNFSDQRLYRQEIGEQPQALTPEAEPQGGLRYANGIFDAIHNRLICVREDHTLIGQDESYTEAVNTIVSIPLADSIDNPTSGDVLVSGHNFYASPRLSPDGTQLAWVAWNHPHMPWTTTELWVADVNTNGELENAKCIAGGTDESALDPIWSPDGMLYFISDRSGWWNLYRWQDGECRSVIEMAAEFGKPQWSFNSPTYGFADANRLICSYTQNGKWSLAVIDTQTDSMITHELPYSSLSNIYPTSDCVHFLAGSSSTPTALVQLDLNTGKTKVLRTTSSVEVDPGYFSEPETIEFSTTNGQTAHAFFYPPQNIDYTAPETEKPPLIVISHGGPTGSTSSTFSLSTQYWTSRGFAVLDVNYGGSTGYGRTYRQRLDGQWGIVDVDDCVNGALHLVNQGKVDVERLVIRGGSAGGYTTLAALAFRDIFKAGASYFGVSDAEALAKETHKFESRYLDSLIGPYPERRDLYLERSPVHHTDGLSCPVIFFQGLEDKIVLPNQSEMMVDALRQKGVPVAYVPFEGEQHGFRRSENIKRSLEAELYFYAAIFGFTLAEEIAPVTIENF